MKGEIMKKLYIFTLLASMAIIMPNLLSGMKEAVYTLQIKADWTWGKGRCIEAAIPTEKDKKIFKKWGLIGSEKDIYIPVSCLGDDYESNQNVPKCLPLTFLAGIKENQHIIEDKHNNTTTLNCESSDPEAKQTFNSELNWAIVQISNAIALAITKSLKKSVQAQQRHNAWQFKKNLLISGSALVLGVAALAWWYFKR